jgi:hypothetical protein
MMRRSTLLLWSLAGVVGLRGLTGPFPVVAAAPAAAYAAPAAASPAAPLPAAAVAPAPDPVAAEAPADFTPQAKLLFRVAACGGQDAEVAAAPGAAAAPLVPAVPTAAGPVTATASSLPPSIDAAVVATHCANIRRRMADYRKRYLERARPFFDKLVPSSAPATVVYPFGGGDLLSALVAFPNATEITTISLEQAGDPRRIDALTKAQLARSLGALRGEIGGLLSVGSNTSLNLSSSQRNELPAQVSSFLMGLAVAGYEPVAMRVFRIEPDGQLHYLSQREIAALDATAAEGRERRPRSLKASWHSPNFSVAFANVELQYRRPGDAVLRVHRHIGWNLGDGYLTEHPELLLHLRRKGKVTLLTKGASYLLWLPTFSKIRDYMLEHLAFMVSDSTGIPPAYANAAGMVQVPYGAFAGAFLEGAELHGQRHSEAFRALWKQSPRRALPMRFGYVDLAKQAHLLVTQPRAAAPPSR